MNEKLKKALMLMLTVISGGFLVLALAKYALPVLAPFIIAWAIAGAVKRPAGKVSARTGVPERVCRLVLSGLSLLVAFSIAFIGIWQLIAAAWELLTDIGERSALYELMQRLERIRLPFLDGGLSEEISLRLREAIDGIISSALSSVASAVTQLGAGLPGALLFLLVTVIAVIYFALDLERINRGAARLVPRGWRDNLRRFGENMLSMTKKYLRSYLLLMLITFGVVLVGLLLIGVEHAALIALIVALLDILPVIGVGTVLLPWSIFELVLGNGGVGIGLAVLFVVNTVQRQLLEPKIVGKSLDMHPIVTLIILYAGYSLLGIFGVILTPVVALVIGALFTEEDHTAEISEGTGAE